jgi:glycine/D-amino acid oxidase-like deaminating enzyme
MQRIGAPAGARVAGETFLHSMAQGGRAPGRGRRVVVVGGGIAGCAAAYYLARAGASVTVVERDAIASHASGANAGNLNPLYRTPPALVPQALAALAQHLELERELGRLGCERYALQPAPRVHLATGATDRPHLEEIAQAFARVPGFHATRLGRAELLRLEPRLGSDVAFGVAVTGNFAVDSGALTRALADGACRLGGNLLTGAADGLTSTGGRVTGVRLGERVVPCDAAVFATGPWVSQVQSWLGVEIPVEPLKGELLLVRLDGGAPATDFHLGSAAVYRRGRDEVWIGGTAQRCGFEAAPTADARAALLEAAQGIMPTLRAAQVLRHVAALRPVTPAGLPIAERAAGWENAYIANGGGMKGVLFAATMASALCGLVLGRDGHPMSPAR